MSTEEGALVLTCSCPKSGGGGLSEAGVGAKLWSALRAILELQ